MAPLRRWAADHWKILRGSLGFTREAPPHATTISRSLAKFKLAQFRATFAAWLTTLPRLATDLAVAVEGKTSKQGHDAQGDPIHMLNVFGHDLNICLAQFPVGGGKPTEPQALKAALGELLRPYRSIRLLTGDALFTQRPLAGEIIESDRDFLLAVKDNQPNQLKAMTTSLGDVTGRRPDARASEKKGRISSPGGSGSRRGSRSPTSARRPGSPGSGSACESTPS